MKRITWKEQNKWFGLDYPTLSGTYKDFTFDIRYDYNGDPKIKPDCDCSLCIYFLGKRIENELGDIEWLVKYSENYLQTFLEKYNE